MRPSDALPVIWRDPADSCYIASVAAGTFVVAEAPRGSGPVPVGVVLHQNCHSNLPAAAVESDGFAAFLKSHLVKTVELHQSYGSSRLVAVLVAVVLAQAEAASLKAFVVGAALPVRLDLAERECSGPGFLRLFL